MKRDRPQAEMPPLLPIQRAQKAKRSPAYTVSFRLDEDFLTRLEAIGAKRGNSIHEQAREMLMAVLMGDEAELLAMRMMLDGLNQKFDTYAAGMADTLEAVLVMNGATEEKAQSFIDERLRNRALLKRDRPQAEKPPLSRIQRAHKAKRNPAHTVSFRLDEEFLTKLEAIGAKRGNSVHEQAREMLMAVLMGDEAELLAMQMTLDGLTQKFDTYAVGMADTLEAILILNGATEEKARSFIDERLRNRALH